MPAARILLQRRTERQQRHHLLKCQPSARRTPVRGQRFPVGAESSDLLVALECMQASKTFLATTLLTTSYREI